jgi:hypothetical protein
MGQYDCPFRGSIDVNLDLPTLQDGYLMMVERHNLQWKLGGLTMKKNIVNESRIKGKRIPVTIQTHEVQEDPSRCEFHAKTRACYWDKHVPTLYDAMVVLTKTMGLLAEALPIALRHIGQLSLKEQADFWRDFTTFDDETDIFMLTDITESGSAKVGETLDQFQQLLEVRTIRPNGLLK